MKPTVELISGFKTGQNKKTIAHNRQLAEQLKKDLTFTFKVRDGPQFVLLIPYPDVTNRKGIYRSPKIQKGVKFANHRTKAPLSRTLVLTVGENLIDERLTGIRTDVPFTTNDYCYVYESHLKALTQFEGRLVSTSFWTTSSFHSGAQPVTAFPKSVLNKTDVAAAIKEYVEDSETESEAENGADDE
ncbi:hypothetical protein B0H13DRAFT_2443027 [Mycena leptocephala]|nr:hypothetical protein B0H13DRAFT_2443027 [Mycena leptocephala]